MKNGDADDLLALAARLPVHADRARLKLIASKIRREAERQAISRVARSHYRAWLEQKPPLSVPWWRRWLGSLERP